MEPVPADHRSRYLHRPQLSRSSTVFSSS